MLAGRKVKLACQRFLKDLDRSANGWRWYYNQDKANAVCSIMELFPHEKGEKRGEPVHLERWQALVFCNIFGFLNRETGYRRFREALVLIPRGNGKSPMAAWVANYMTWFDGEKGAETYCASTTQDQSFHVFDPAKYIVQTLELDRRLGIVVPKGKFGTTMYQPSSSSYLRVIIGRGKDGKAPHCVINDEYHQQTDNDLYDSLKRGMNKRRQSLMFNISTAGDTIEGPCYRMCEQVVKILEGEYENDRLFGIIYDVDADVPWTSEEASVMSNPNYGVSIDVEAMRSDQAEARQVTALQNPFRCKNQNHWAQSLDGWINMASWDACKSDIRPEDYEGKACFHGSDLAFKLDICGVAKVFAWSGDDGEARYAAFAHGYLPRKQVDSTRPHLQAWEKQGFLTVHEGAEVDFRELIDDTVADVKRFCVTELCYDPKFAGPQYAQFVSAETEVIPVEVRPGDYHEGMLELESAIETGRLQHDGNPLLRWCMANITAKRNQMTGFYTIPGKAEKDKKIDLGIALIIAMTRARSVAESAGGAPSTWDGNVTWF